MSLSHCAILLEHHEGTMYILHNSVLSHYVTTIYMLHLVYNLTISFLTPRIYHTHRATHTSLRTKPHTKSNPPEEKLLFTENILRA
jgi:hypothetical protein